MADHCMPRRPAIAIARDLLRFGAQASLHAGAVEIAGDIPKCLAVEVEARRLDLLALFQEFVVPEHSRAGDSLILSIAEQIVVS